jgi:hypothetical protein
MLKMLLGPVANIAGNWVDGKVEETKAKAAVKVEKAKADAEVQKRVATGEIDWEANMADATKDSWKDEFALVVLLLPSILVFIPSLTEHVKAGFEVLNTLPDWYQYLLFIAVSSSFGIKGADRLMNLRGKK